jgi:hypothetical protein
VDIKGYRKEIYSNGFITSANFFIEGKNCCQQLRVTLTFERARVLAATGIWGDHRCYILDAEDHIVQAHDLDCDTDAQAASAAEGLLSQDPYHRSAEVWKATRRIVKVDRAASLRLRLERHGQRGSRILGSAA